VCFVQQWRVCVGGWVSSISIFFSVGQVIIGLAALHCVGIAPGEALRQ
jgi:hypothetical protein